MSSAIAAEREAGRPAPAAWPAWAKVVASLALGYHLAAMLAGAMASPPASVLEFGLGQLFAPYYRAIDQGYSYRYYSPEPPPTPVATAVLSFGDGRPDIQVRIPDRQLRPRMRYQRHLALANTLAEELGQMRSVGAEPGQGRWARSYASHLGKAHPGCRSVSLSVQYHLIPDPERVRELLRTEGRADLDAPEFYTVPERIGDFPCDAS